MKTHYIRALRPLIHSCIIAGSFWGAYVLRQYTDLIPGVQIRIPPFVVSELMIFAGVSVGLYLLIGRQRKLFQLYGLVLGYYQRFIKAIIVRAIIITCIAFFGAGFVFDAGVSRFIIVVSVISVRILITIVDGLFDTILYRLGRRYQLAVISRKDSKAQDAATLLATTTRAQVRIIDYQAIQNIDTQEFDTVVLVGSIPKSDLQSLADKVVIGGGEFFHIQDDDILHDLIFTPQKLGPLIGLEYKASVINEWGLVIKRLFDIVGSLLGLLMILPIIAWVAYRIKREDGGPIFFVQYRVGLSGRLFRFYKLRSMKLQHCTGEGYGGDEADQYYNQLISSDLNTRPGSMPKIHNDPRVTRIGKWIRAASLDELPQLWNVLKGDMSLIGPRPHLAREVAGYEAWQHRLLSVKPGITGYAQIFGRDTLDFTEEAKLDIYYIQNRSVWMDIYVLFATLGVISKGR